MKTQETKKIFLSFRNIMMISSVVVVSLGFSIYKYIEIKKIDEKRMIELSQRRIELDQKMKSLKENYSLRFNTFRSMVPQSDQNLFAQVEPKLKFLEMNSLQSEAELIQFDQIQNEISQVVASTLASKINKGVIDPKYSKVYQNIERIEKQIIDSRAELTKMTIDYNKIQSELLEKNKNKVQEFPMFAVEKSMFSQKNKNLKQ